MSGRPRYYQIQENVPASVTEARSVGVRRYQTGMPYDAAAVRRGIKSAWLNPSANLGVVRDCTGPDGVLRVMFGLRGDRYIGWHDDNRQRIGWDRLEGVLVETALVEYVQDEANGELMLLTYGGRQKITDERLWAEHADHFCLDRESIDLMPFSPEALRKLCLETYGHRLYWVGYRPAGKVSFHSVGQAQFRGRPDQPIDPDDEAMKLICDDPNNAIDGFRSETEVQLPGKDKPQAISVRLGRDGTVVVYMPALPVLAGTADLEHEAMYYEVARTAYGQTVSSAEFRVVPPKDPKGFGDPERAGQGFKAIRERPLARDRDEDLRTLNRLIAHQPEMADRVREEAREWFEPKSPTFDFHADTDTFEHYTKFTISEHLGRLAPLLVDAMPDCANRPRALECLAGLIQAFELHDAVEFDPEADALLLGTQRVNAVCWDDIPDWCRWRLLYRCYAQSIERLRWGSSNETIDLALARKIDAMTRKLLDEKAPETLHLPVLRQLKEAGQIDHDISFTAARYATLTGKSSDDPVEYDDYVLSECGLALVPVVAGNNVEIEERGMTFVNTGLGCFTPAKWELSVGNKTVGTGQLSGTVSSGDKGRVFWPATVTHKIGAGRAEQTAALTLIFSKFGKDFRFLVASGPVAEIVRVPAQPKASTRQTPKPIEMKGKAMVVRDALWAEAQEDQGRVLSEILDDAGVSHETFNRSSGFKEARDAWESLKNARSLRRDFASQHYRSTDPGQGNDET